MRKRYGDKVTMREIVSASSLHYWLRVERRRMKTYVSRIDNSHGRMGANMSNWYLQEPSGSTPMEDHMDLVQSSVVEGNILLI